MKLIPQTLSARLKSYSLFAGSAFAGHVLNSQIIYTDIDPDLHFDPGFPYYFFDLAGDGNFDFYMHGIHDLDIATAYYGAWYWTIDLVELQLYDGNSIAGNTTNVDYNKLPFAFNAGDFIFYGIADWNTEGNLTLAYHTYYIYIDTAPHDPGSFSLGNFIDGAFDKYLGIRSMVDGNYYYGWLRLDVDSTNNSFTIKDYAYNATPNAGIYAGQLISNIHEGDHSNDIFYSFPEITINLTVDHTLNVEIANISGEMILSEKLTSNKIDVGDFMPGIYIVRLLDAQKCIATKKIMIY